MTANIQVSKKLDDGTILVLGHEDYDSFAALASSALGADGAESLLRSFDTLVPVSAGRSQFETAEANVRQAFPQAAPVEYAPAAPAPQQPPASGGPERGATRVNPDTGQVEKWVPPGVSKKTNKPYQGFWSSR